MLEPNSVIGRYEIQRHVAHGGMGTLYLAHDPVLGRSVALKLFLGDLDQPDARERFVREARAAAALSHPHIVTIYDYGEYSSQPYMVLEFIDGQTLASLIRRRIDIPAITKLRWMEELCSAVEYAHVRGVIHRDIKPLNLMIDSYGRLKVLDFGIARMRGSLASHATARIGTAGYMAPEQIRGGNIDPRSDLFSIGIVAYEAFSFVEPFAAEVEPAITNRILEVDPKPLSEVVPSIDPELAELVWKALRKDPDARFQDAESMRLAFSGVRRRIEALSTGTGVERFVLPRHEHRADDPPRPTPRRRIVEEGRATPGLSPEKRAERDALVKKRIAEIHEAVREARAHLAARKFVAARAACERALLLDKAHPEVLEVLHRVEVESDRARADELLIEGHRELERGGLTKAQEVLRQARALAPGHPETGRLDRALRIARASLEVARRRAERLQQAIADAESALDRGEVEQALSHAREACELDPASTRARALEEEALRRVDDESCGILAGPEEPTMLGRSTGRERGTPITPPVRQRPISPRSRAALRLPVWLSSMPARLMTSWRTTPRRHVQVSALIVVAVLIAVGAAIIWAPRDAPPPAPAPLPQGQVVVDAAPWATVKEIRQRNTGQLVPLPEDGRTPVTLTLTAGAYDVTLQGPDGQTRVVPVTVAGNERVVLDVAQFNVMTADKYFEFYTKGPVSKGGGK